MTCSTIFCEECGKPLVMMCDYKKYEGKLYCIKCYKEKVYPKFLEKLRKNET